MNVPFQKALLTGISVLVAGALQAAPIVTWEVAIDTRFDTDSVTHVGLNPVTVIDDKSLRWGISTGQGRSGLDITDSPIATFVDTDGPVVPNVSITHLNRPMTIGGGSLATVDVLSTLVLRPFDPLGEALPPQTIAFNVRFFETPNAVNPCADGEPNGVGLNVNGCADIFVVDQASLNFAFQYPDIGGDTPGFLRTYFISFLELTSGFNPLPLAACEAVLGVSAPCLGFRTPEREDTTVTFGALITTLPVRIVPEPGSLALLGLGLAALSLLRRRKSV